MNILEKARQILYERAEEKERQYGPFDKGLEITRDIANLMTNSNMSLQQVYAVIIALKLSREAFSHKEDNILDAIVYLAQYNDHYKRLENKDECVLCGEEIEDTISKLTNARRANGSPLFTDEELFKLTEKIKLSQ